VRYNFCTGSLAAFCCSCKRECAVCWCLWSRESTGCAPTDLRVVTVQSSIVPIPGAFDSIAYLIPSVAFGPRQVHLIWGSPGAFISESTSRHGNVIARDQPVMASNLRLLSSSPSHSEATARASPTSVLARRPHALSLNPPTSHSLSFFSATLYPSSD